MIITMIKNKNPSPSPSPSLSHSFTKSKSLAIRENLNDFLKKQKENYQALGKEYRTGIYFFHALPTKVNVEEVISGISNDPDYFTFKPKEKNNGSAIDEKFQKHKESSLNISVEPAVVNKNSIFHLIGNLPITYYFNDLQKQREELLSGKSYDFQGNNIISSVFDSTFMKAEMESQISDEFLRELKNLRYLDITQQIENFAKSINLTYVLGFMTRECFLHKDLLKLINKNNTIIQSAYLPSMKSTSLIHHLKQYTRLHRYLTNTNVNTESLIARYINNKSSYDLFINIYKLVFSSSQSPNFANAFSKIIRTMEFVQSFNLNKSINDKDFKLFQFKESDSREYYLIQKIAKKDVDNESVASQLLISNGFLFDIFKIFAKTPELLNLWHLLSSKNTVDLQKAKVLMDFLDYIYFLDEVWMVCFLAGFKELYYVNLTLLSGYTNDKSLFQELYQELEKEFNVKKIYENYQVTRIKLILNTDDHGLEEDEKVLKKYITELEEPDRSFYFLYNFPPREIGQNVKYSFNVHRVFQGAMNLIMIRNDLHGLHFMMIDKLRMSRISENVEKSKKAIVGRLKGFEKRFMKDLPDRTFSKGPLDGLLIEKEFYNIQFNEHFFEAFYYLRNHMLKYNMKNILDPDDCLFIDHDKLISLLLDKKKSFYELILQGELVEFTFKLPSIYEETFQKMFNGINVNTLGLTRNTDSEFIIRLENKGEFIICNKKLNASLWCITIDDSYDREEIYSMQSYLEEFRNHMILFAKATKQNSEEPSNQKFVFKQGGKFYSKYIKSPGFNGHLIAIETDFFGIPVKFFNNSLSLPFNHINEQKKLSIGSVKDEAEKTFETYGFEFDTLNEDNIYFNEDLITFKIFKMGDIKFQPKGTPIHANDKFVKLLNESIGKHILGSNKFDLTASDDPTYIKNLVRYLNMCVKYSRFISEFKRFNLEDYKMEVYNGFLGFVKENFFVFTAEKWKVFDMKSLMWDKDYCSIISSCEIEKTMEDGISREFIASIKKIHFSLYLFISYEPNISFNLYGTIFNVKGIFMDFRIPILRDYTDNKYSGLSLIILNHRLNCFSGRSISNQGFSFVNFLGYLPYILAVHDYMKKKLKIYHGNINPNNIIFRTDGSFYLIGWEKEGGILKQGEKHSNTDLHDLIFSFLALEKKLTVKDHNARLQTIQIVLANIESFDLKIKELIVFIRNEFTEESLNKKLEDIFGIKKDASDTTSVFQNAKTNYKHEEIEIIRKKCSLLEDYKFTLDVKDFGKNMVSWATVFINTMASTFPKFSQENFLLLIKIFNHYFGDIFKLSGKTHNDKPWEFQLETKHEYLTKINADQLTLQYYKILEFKFLLSLYVKE